MKKRKIVALLLSASMVMGAFTGCSKVKKVNQKSMEKAAEKFDAEVYDDVDDMEDIESDDLEDGVLLEFDNDAISDFVDDNMDEDDIEEAIDMINEFLDTDIEIDLDDIEEASSYIRAEDGNVMVIAQIDLGNEDVMGELFNGILDAQDDANDLIEDYLDELEDVEYFEDFEINLENLSRDEYYFNGNNVGYLKMSVTVEDIENFIEEDLPGIIDDLDMDIDEDDLEDVIDDVLDEFDFDIIAGGLYFNGSTVVLTAVFSDDEDFTADYEAYMKSLGLASPTDAELSDYGEKLVLGSLIPNIFSYITRARYAAEAVAQHNAEIEAVVAEIDANM